MSQSSFRVQTEASGVSGRFYKWDAGKPVAVRVAFDVIERLERLAVDNFRSLTARGSEVGGILLGEVSPGDSRLFTIQEFEQIECDYSRGPLYRLSDPDMSRLDAAIQAHKSRRAKVIGFFRSHTRKGLCLDESDLSLMQSRFGDPDHIALLVRPFATKASTAGIFIWENGAIRSEDSYLEFPFQTSQLTPAAPEASAEPASVSMPEPVPAVKPVVRARVIPMASRLDLASPAVTSPPPVPAEPAFTDPPVETPGVSPVPPASSAISGRVDEVQKPADSEPDPEPISFEGTSSSGILSRLRITWIWGAVAAAVLACSGVLFVYPGLVRHSARPMVPLTLRIERTAGDLLLTWNRESDAIRNAKSANLSISDGERQENYQMDLAQLRTGSIVYSPLTPDVSFRLDVNGTDQTKIASEMVRVLRTRPSPMPQQDAKTSAPPPVAAPTPTPVAATDPVAPAEPEPAPAPKRAAPRPFNVASLAQRLRPATTADVPLPAPLLSSSPSPGSVSLGAITATQIAVPAPTVDAPPSQRSTQVKQPVLVTRVNPEYPPMARQLKISGAVKVVLVIGADGRVKDIRPVSGNPVLYQATVAAVRKWVYSPMLVDGKPTQSESEVELNFKLKD